MQNLTIGKLAQATAVNVETVRYYQRIGLIKEPPKPLTGYRKYDASLIDTIFFIKRAQQLGFQLLEIKELLDLGSGQCRDVMSMAQVKRDKINRHIDDLTAMRQELDVLIESCRKSDKTQGCAMIDTLLKK
ncbi:MAG TPA: MerR family transcriptional regulator [Oceanospirillales bacterium]|nr:MerR family transcriptional regulator [Oceanospirillales bacterium]